VEAEEE
jgi:hypothetical protein